MSRRESDPQVALAIALVISMTVVFLAVFFIAKALLHSDPRPSCESVGAHVVWLDNDHTVCVKNGKVV